MSFAIIHTMSWLLIVTAAGRGLHHNMVLIVPGRLERVNARQAQDATSKIRWSGFCSIEFSVDKVLIVGRCRRFPSVGLLMETREDDKVHNNLALTSCILRVDE